MLRLARNDGFGASLPRRRYERGAEIVALPKAQRGPEYVAPVETDEDTAMVA